MPEIRFEADAETSVVMRVAGGNPGQPDGGRKP